LQAAGPSGQRDGSGSAPAIDKDENGRPYPGICQMAIFADQKLIKMLPQQVSVASKPEMSV
jgi:hypothetical protein